MSKRLLASALTDTHRMLRIALAALLLSPALAAAQSEFFPPVADFLGPRVIHDVRSAAMGSAGASLPDTAPLAFIENPARLAEGGVMPRLRVTGSGHPDITGLGSLSTAHLAASYPVGRAVLGGAVSNLSYGNSFSFVSDDGSQTFEIGNAALSVAAATRLGNPQAYLDVGVAGRLSQIRGADRTAGVRTRKTQPSLDVGAIGTLRLIEAGRPRDGAVSPSLYVSAGYVQRYLGPAFDSDGDLPDLNQPRAASLGTSARFGLDTELGGRTLRALSVDFAIEAEVDLKYADLNANGTTTFEDGALVGPMRARDALFGTSAHPYVVGQRGVRVTAAEAVWVAVGQIDSGGNRYSPDQYEDLDCCDGTSWGVGVSVGGALRFLGAASDRPAMARIGDGFDITVDYTESGVLRLGSLGVSARL